MINEIDKAQKEFFDNHMTCKEVLDFLKPKDVKLRYLEKVKIPHGYPLPYKNAMYMYNKKEVYEAKAYNDFILANCMSQEQVIEYLGLVTCDTNDTDPTHIIRLIKGFKLKPYRMIGFGCTKYFRKDQIEEIKAKQKLNHIDNVQKEFFDKHMTRKEVLDLLKVGDRIFDYLTKVKIPVGYPLLSKNSQYMYDKKEVYEIKAHNDFVLTNCITQKQVVEYLDLVTRGTKDTTSTHLITLTKEFNLEIYNTIGFGHVKYFKKDQIEELKAKQNEFWREHIGTVEIKRIYPPAIDSSSRYFDGLETFEIPAYAIIKTLCTNGRKQNVYKRVEALKRIEPFIKRKKMLDTVGITYFDTFEKRMNLIKDELTKFNLSTYTKEKWYGFVKSKLKQTQSLKTAENRITCYMSISINIINKALEEFNVSEIYSLRSKELALIYNWAGSDEKSRLCNFFAMVEEDVRLQLRNSKGYTKGFSLDEINKIRVKEIKEFNKRKQENSKMNKEIYDFEVYSKIFKFLSDTKLHTKMSIDKMQKDRDIRYPSIWLYLMLHLNNAWRNGDVSNFPRLHIYDLLSEFHINGLEWFKDNELTLIQSRRLVERVINQEFRISKTQIKGHFFSSDILAPAIATAILIIETFLVSKGVLNPDTEYVPLLDFKNKYNEPTDSQLKNFFIGMDGCEKFTFSSKKMNKSVMTFIYHLSNMSGDDNALKLVQQLRNHMDKNSPLFYVDFNMKQIEGLTKQLFKRGEFGYIPSLLVQKIQGKKLTFNEMTEKVVRVNNAFNDVFKVHNTISFLNTVNHERAMVARMIEESSLEECEQFLTDMFTDNLPSGEQDIQCLMSKSGCQRHDLKRCLGCQYSIPSIYALTTVCKAIISDIDEYKKTSNLTKQMKIALSIDRKIIVLKEAFHQFGEEYVYACLGLSEERLLDEIELIPEPSEFYRELSGIVSE